MQLKTQLLVIILYETARTGFPWAIFVHLCSFTWLLMAFW